MYFEITWLATDKLNSVLRFLLVTRYPSPNFLLTLPTLSLISGNCSKFDYYIYFYNIIRNIIIYLEIQPLELASTL